MMTKLQEYFFRALIAGVMSGLIVGPLAGFAIMLFTGVHGSEHFAIGISILAAIVLFFTPPIKSGAEEWVRELAEKEEQRKRYEKELSDRAKQIKESRTANKKNR